MNIQLLANSIIKLPKELAHIPITYGYSYYDSKLQHATFDNSFKAKQLLRIDNLLNSFNPITDNDRLVTNEIAKNVAFLDQALPEDFTKELKIQLNINSDLNSQFKKIATSLFNTQHPLTLALTSNISFMYPNTKQVVIGTKEFDLKRKDYEKGIVIFNFSFMKQSSLEKAVAFTLFHEVSHTLENYRNETYGQLDNKMYDLYKVVKYFSNNIDANENDKYSKSPTLKVLPTPKDYNLDDKFVDNLSTLFGEIYADCGAILLQYNYEIKNQTYTTEKFDNHIDIIRRSRNIEKSVAKEMGEKVIELLHHDTVHGIESLNYALKLTSQEVISDQKMHDLCELSVTHGTNHTLKEFIDINPQYQKLVELLCNMSLINNEIKVAKNFVSVNDYLNLDLDNSKKVSMKM
jgi:hypothetical protein